MGIRKIHIHLGPHRTGSCSIQAALSENSELLSNNYNLTYIETPLVSKAAKHFKADRLFEASQALEGIAKICAEAPGDCVISCGDFCGVFPGGRGSRNVYPHFWRNLNSINEALNAFDCRYYFFLRPPDEWIKSVYSLTLRQRLRFSRLESFAEFLHADEVWDAIIAKPAEDFGQSFVRIDYPLGEKKSATRSLLSAITGLDRKEFRAIAEKQLNVSPSETDIALMERTNRSGASREAKRRAKSSLFEQQETGSLSHEITGQPDWFEAPEKPGSLPKVLEPLWERVMKRVRTQEQPNLMPDTDVDLRPLRNVMVEADGDFPDVNRGKMANQAEILIYRFRGLPEVCFLLGLAISYLRRETPHTRHASILFQRLWAEEHDIMLGLLPTRWLISSFQTFLDHGINEHQRIIGSGSFFFANILKAYEAERALEEMPPDAVYPSKLPKTKMGFSGLDRFKLGGSDLILNTNALLLEYSARDEVAGRVVQEFLARAKASQSIFSRMDKSRQAHGIDIKQFSNCWSFFDEP